jgi:hypothetical protein
LAGLFVSGLSNTNRKRTYVSVNELSVNMPILLLKDNYILGLISLHFDAEFELFVYSDILAKNSVLETNTVTWRLFRRCDPHQIQPPPLRNLDRILFHMQNYFPKIHIILPSLLHL